MRGRIVYDFSGSSCDGYALKFRQVTELDSGEGKVALSDLRTSTWEEGEGKSFRFTSENYMDDEKISQVDGQADRAKSDVAVKLNKPEDKKFDAGAVVFPTEHMRLLIEAAHAGRTLLEVAVYDGSESGEKIYQSLSVIGQRIEPDKKPEDAAADKDALAGLARWPVTISYFDKVAKKPADDQPGEQTPIYAISFEMYENGISRALKLDYGDFVIDGKMTLARGPAREGLPVGGSLGAGLRRCAPSPPQHGVATRVGLASLSRTLPAYSLRPVAC